MKLNEKLLDCYMTETEKLNDLKHEYDLTKLGLEQNKLVLKYSPEFESYKTIKEKEERATLITAEQQKLLIDLKDKVRQQKLIVETLKLQIEYELKSD